MSLSMYLGETDSQTSSMNTICNEVKGAMEEVKDSVEFFIGASLLQGKTYRSAKGYMAVTYQPIAEGIIRLCDELILQNSGYPADFRSEVSPSDVIEHKVREQIEQIDRQIEQYKMIEDISPITLFPIFSLQAVRRALQQKLEDLYTFNSTSSTNYDIALEYTQAILAGLQEIENNTSFNIVSGMFNISKMNLDFISDMKHAYYKRKALEEYGNYLDAHEDSDQIDRVANMLRFEEEYPEEAKKVDELLQPLAGKDRREIKIILYNAEEPYRSLAIRYADRLEVKLVEINKDDEDDKPSSSFSYSSNTISYVYETDRENGRGAYFTFFHEMGHAIDYNYGKDEQNQKSLYDPSKKSGNNAFFSEYFELDGTTLANRMHTDFEDKVGAAIDDILNGDGYSAVYDSNQKENIRQNIMINLKSRDKLFEYLSFDEKGIQMHIEDEFSKKLSGHEHSLVSDVYGGVSDKTISGSYNHSDDYWYNIFGFRKREPNREGFAEYYARQVLYSKDTNDAGIKSAENHLPQSKELMDEMFDVMKKE